MSNEQKLPNSWAITKVGDICLDLQYGYTASATNKPCGPRLLRITDIQDGQVQWPSVPYCSIDPSQISKYALRDGDIVFARTGGTVGKSFIISAIPEESVFASYLIRLTAHSSVNPSFLYYFFQSLSYWEQIGLKKGGLQGNVNATTLASLDLPMCPTSEQARIVAKVEELFSELDKGIENLTTAREQLKVYRQAVLKHSFEGKLTADWRAEHPDKLETPDALLSRIRAERETRYVQELNDWQQAVTVWQAKGAIGKKPRKPARPPVIDLPQAADTMRLPALPKGWAYFRLGALIDEPAYGTSKRCDYNNDGIGVLRIPNIAQGTIDATDLKFAEFDDDERETYRLLAGDILTIRSNGSIALVGQCGLITESEQQYLYAGYLIRLRPFREAVLPRYLLAALSGHFARGQIESKAKSTSGVNNINAGELQSLIVPLCGTSEQTLLTARLDGMLSSIDAIDAEIVTQLERARALQQSILKKAFSGQLVVQDPSDEPASVLLERIRAQNEDNGTSRNKNNKNGKKEAA